MNDIAYESNPTVRIKFVQSGGFAGIEREIVLDTNSLSPGEAKSLHILIENSGFFDLTSWSPTIKKGADYFEYEITVESEGEIHTVKTNDITLPGKLVPLIRYLRQKNLRAK